MWKNIKKKLKVFFKKNKYKYFSNDDIKSLINNDNKCIVTANNFVYDVTDFLQDHPGGKMCIQQKCKNFKDCSEDFLFHGINGKKMWKKYKIGILI